MGLTKGQKDNVRWAVWIGTLILAGLVWVLDESKDNAKYEALVEVTIPEIKEDTEKILKKLEDHEKRWREQSEFNGGVNAYFRIDAGEHPGP